MTRDQVAAVRDQIELDWSRSEAERSVPLFRNMALCQFLDLARRALDKVPPEPGVLDAVVGILNRARALEAK